MKDVTEAIMRLRGEPPIHDGEVFAVWREGRKLVYVRGHLQKTGRTFTSHGDSELSLEIVDPNFSEDA